MPISVLVSTYEQPEWLEKVFWGLRAQSDRDFEVLVADDGSGPETRAVVDRARAEFDVPVEHVWHPDAGFRKCTILNRAIAAARGEYLVFLDGDCVPRADFLAVHRRLATPGRFLSGGALRLTMAVSRLVTRGDVVTQRLFQPAWLRAQGMPRSRRLLRLGAGPRLAAWLDRFTTTGATFNGGNASVWKADALRVNGFDERMGHGGLDREFGERLHHAGVRGRQVRHRAVVVHLDHGRGYSRPDVVARNRAIRDEVAARRLARTEFGLGDASADPVGSAG
jgi:glycosyltransferase involved in cell wall biosynthesis